MLTIPYSRTQQRRNVSSAPIVGATKVAHIQDALAAEQLELSADEMSQLEELYVPHPIAGHG